MFCEKRSHRPASKSLPTKRATAFAKSLRHSSCVNAVREKPTIRVSFGSRSLRKRWYSAGTSLRCVRSPEAPKMTNVWGILNGHRRESAVDVDHFACDESASQASDHLIGCSY